MWSSRAQAGFSCHRQPPILNFTERQPDRRIDVERSPLRHEPVPVVLTDAIRQAGRPVAFYTYLGTGHWFFEPDRKDAYSQKAAELAWERTLAFLQRR